MTEAQAMAHNQIFFFFFTPLLPWVIAHKQN